MKENKKIWFNAFSFNFWIPVSIEGWALTVVFLFIFSGIFKLNHLSGDVPFSLSRNWPFLLELLIAIGSFYFITSGHVRKRGD